MVTHGLMFERRRFLGFGEPLARQKGMGLIPNMSQGKPQPGFAVDLGLSIDKWHNKYRLSETWHRSWPEPHLIGVVGTCLTTAWHSWET